MTQQGLVEGKLYQVVCKSHPWVSPKFGPFFNQKNLIFIMGVEK